MMHAASVSLLLLVPVRVLPPVTRPAEVRNLKRRSSSYRAGGTVSAYEEYRIRAQSNHNVNARHSNVNDSVQAGAPATRHIYTLQPAVALTETATALATHCTDWLGDSRDERGQCTASAAAWEGGCMMGTRAPRWAPRARGVGG